MTASPPNGKLRQIHALVCELTESDGRFDNVFTSEEACVDDIIHRLTPYVEQQRQQQRDEQEMKARVNDVMETIVSIALLDFTRKAWVGSKGDAFDTIAVGLNTISEELCASTVSKNYLLNITNSILDSMIITDQDDNINMVNASACRLLGYGEEDLVGTAINDYFVEEFEAQTFETYDLAEKIMVTKDERHIPVSCSRSQLRDEQGQLLGYICVAQDISERKRTEKELRQSEIRLREVQKIARIGDWSLDLTNGRIVWSDELRRIVGIDPDEEIKEETILRNVHQDDRGIVQKAVRDGLGGYQPADIEYRIICADGVEKVISSKARLKRDEAGRPQYMVGFIQDITDELQMKDKLLLTQFCVDNASFGIVLVGPEANIMQTNKQACQLLGYTAEELGKLHVYDLDPAFPFEKWKAQRPAAQRQGSATLETVHRRKDGSLYPVEVTSTYISFQGQDLAFTFFRDITDRKEAEAALKENEERLQQAVRAGNIGIFDHDHVTDRIYWSAEQRDIYGWGADELVTYEKCFQHTHPDDKEWLDEAVRRAHSPEGDGGFDVEHRIIDRKGEVRWVKTRSQTSFERTSNGRRPLRTTGAVMDVTDQKQQEEALRQSEGRFRSLVESSPDRIMVLDKQYQIQYVNLITFGDDINEVIGSNLFDFASAAYRDAIRRTLDEVVQTGNPGQYEMYSHRPDGSMGWLHARVMPILDGADVTGLTLIITDITERKQTELELRSNQNRLQLALEAAGAGAWEWTEEPDELIWSEEIYMMMGMTPNGVGANYDDWLRCIHPDDRQSADDLVAQHVEDFSDLNMEFRVVWPDGSVHWISNIAKTRFDESGQRVGTYGIQMDITERKEAEVEIRQLNEELEQRVIERTRELEQANEEIRQFAYIVSHDLRAPLVNLKGFSTELRYALGVVQDGCDEVMTHLDPAKQQALAFALQEDIPEALQFIESAVANMDGFTKAILKLSRLGRVQLEVIKVDTAVVVDRMLNLLAYQIEQQKIVVRVGTLPVVMADLVSMEQIFTNLLSNAVAYLRSDRPGEIDIGADRQEAETVFWIRDNGRGIAPENMDKVFAPFRRAGKHKKPGEGMGLAYVQTLVRRHGGRIWYESEVGVGTTFLFTVSNDLTTNLEGL